MQLQDLMQRAMPEPNTGCYLWIGAHTVAGYGCIKIAGRVHLAHRLSLMLATGADIAGMDVCHRCDTPACINPDHLFVGTRKENMVDAVRKDRIWRSTRTRCKAGHELTGGNVHLYRVPRTGYVERRCRRCQSEQSKAKRREFGSSGAERR